ncbi:MAG: hypothetical protein NUW06_06680 [Candidatus Acetothermia bacterium]|jgi:hypothetical protein|nr:hypothetical protein [Candidatus Acetothermia bacterium]MDH7505435.1 hypothetical protein [Candidatus Acetothermia bacterium]
MAGLGLLLRGASKVGIFALAFWVLAYPALSEELSGRWEIGAELVPQTTSYETSAFDLGLYSQLDLGLDYEGLGFDGTLFFSNLGLRTVWLGWEATFPMGEAIAAAMKRTLASNDWVKVLRSFPSPVRPGEAFAVTIIIEALQPIPPGVEFTLLEELPRGWPIEPIAPPGVRIAKESLQWTVTLAAPGAREEIRYIGYVPSEAAPGSYTITGTVRSALFPDLDFSDAIELILQPLAIPARTRLSQDLIFTGGTELAFKSMLFSASAMLDPRLKLTNYFSLYDLGPAQTPSLASRDTLIIDGETSGGIKAKLALKFSSDSALAFDSGSLQISGLSIEGVLIRSTTLFNQVGLQRISMELDYSTTILGVPLALKALIAAGDKLELELDYYTLRLTFPFDGLFRLYDYYGPLKYDGDDDGAEEEHFELKRRQVYLEFALDKLDLRSTSTFEPILGTSIAMGLTRRSPLPTSPGRSCGSGGPSRGSLSPAPSFGPRRRPSACRSNSL